MFGKLVAAARFGARDSLGTANNIAWLVGGLFFLALSYYTELQLQNTLLNGIVSFSIAWILIFSIRFVANYTGLHETWWTHVKSGGRFAISREMLLAYCVLALIGAAYAALIYKNERELEIVRNEASILKSDMILLAEREEKKQFILLMMERRDNLTLARARVADVIKKMEKLRAEFALPSNGSPLPMPSGHVQSSFGMTATLLNADLIQELRTYMGYDDANFYRIDTLNRLDRDTDKIQAEIRRLNAAY